MIFSLVIKNSGNEDDAIDVLQDALIVLYEKVQLGTFELTVKLTTYIYGVSRNIWYNKLRGRGTVIINTKDVICFFIFLLSFRTLTSLDLLP